MKKTALITGASSGIGLELAKLFVRDGLDLLLVARDQIKLQKAATLLRKENNINVTVVPMDLSQPRASQELYRITKEKNIVVEILVNSAGYGINGPFLESDKGEQLGMVHVNITALTELTRLFGADMVKRKSGKILNVASVAAYFPGPLMAVYYASKSYVLSFSESLAEELKHTGVTVTCLCPGPTKTGFQSRSRLGKAKLFNSNIMDASVVAKMGYEGLMMGKRVVVTGLINQLQIFLSRFVPRSFAAKLIKRLHEG